ncbi:HAD-IIIA family hydrolase [Risungbinella massiliensis]|uniref:HAD-IIIA family hydrolase n=1 Tax=Risungbinella massiliensis TaxID=1329796 RepID=UPI0005CC2A99|nr:HAD-IIIA family hydrolase [Risungbinella massiliensis]
MKLEAVFVDRDGTMGGSDQVEYPGKFKLFSFTLSSIAHLQQCGVKVFSFTNQPGIARREAHVSDFEQEITAFGLDGLYLCPHLHGAGCCCRKPAIGLLEQAAHDHQLNLSHCAVVGDRFTDIVAAHRAGCLSVLVQTGAGQDAIGKAQAKEWGNINPNYVARDLPDAVDWLLQLK